MQRAEHGQDAVRRPLADHLGAEDARPAGELVEAIVDAAVEHRVLDARSQAQAAGALHGLDPLAPGLRRVAGGGNRRGLPANRLRGALPHEHGPERRQEQSERQRREPRTHPSREVRCRHGVFADLKHLHRSERTKGRWLFGSEAEAQAAADHGAAGLHLTESREGHLRLRVAEDAAHAERIS